MGKEVVFIQGGGEGAHKIDGELVASLKRKLGADYRVKYPQMPNENDPDYSVWRPQIHKEIEALSGEAVLVGHSLGGYFLLKYLSEEKVPKKLIIGVFLIAVPYPSGDKNWTFEGFTLPKDFGAKLPGAARVFIYHSPDDQTVSFAHMALYGKKLPKATVRETSGGHQLNNELSVVASDINGL
jgi:predicted alpha/beta hydrolase family esterase